MKIRNRNTHEFVRSENPSRIRYLLWRYRVFRRWMENEMLSKRTMDKSW